MNKRKLSEANEIAAKLIEKLINNELILYRNGKSNLNEEEIKMLFVIRDGHNENILDPWKLEEYDNCYEIDIYS